MTPHISAGKADFASVCLLPGDPLRAKFIAETYLTEVRCVTSVRNMLGFTGFFKGVKVSVMGSGMGIPSLSIYAKELITEYGVTDLIRVGSCGAIQESLSLGEIVVATGASTDSQVNRTRFAGMDFSAVSDFQWNLRFKESADKMSIVAHFGTIFSADLFYNPLAVEQFELLRDRQILAVEMEAAGLFGVAAEYGVSAATICTVSDHILQGDSMNSDERERSFTEMMELTLSAVVAENS